MFLHVTKEVVKSEQPFAEDLFWVDPVLSVECVKSYTPHNLTHMGCGLAGKALDTKP